MIRVPENFIHPHPSQINNIPRWAKCIVIVIDLNLLLPCVLGSPHCTCQNQTLPAGLASLHRSTQSMVIFGSILKEDALPQHLFLSMQVCYLSRHTNHYDPADINLTFNVSLLCSVRDMAGTYVEFEIQLKPKYTNCFSLFSDTLPLRSSLHRR